ncbi:MAG: DNA repair protein RecO [Ruminococcaceae bacterium]|nr:DNA repair protein RecO [Oscillospiraceae bacterium]
MSEMGVTFMEIVMVSGLVVRTTDYGERDRILSLYTHELGLITVMANGSRSLKSRSLVATELFCYSRFALTKRGDRYTVKEVELIESFFDLRSDVAKIALAGYACEVISHVGTENLPDPDLLRLCLNTLYAIAKEKAPGAQIKGAFEMRAAAILGFMPELAVCADCGEEGEDVVLDVMNGAVRCGDCRREAEENPIPPDGEDAHATVLCLLTASARAALFYVLCCPLEKILSFRLESEADMESFAHAAETYLLHHLERSFKNLEFYKTLLMT